MLLCHKDALILQFSTHAPASLAFPMLQAVHITICLISRQLMPCQCFCTGVLGAPFQRWCLRGEHWAAHRHLGELYITHHARSALPESLQVSSREHHEERRSLLSPPLHPSLALSATLMECTCVLCRPAPSAQPSSSPRTHGALSQVSHHQP